jgi:imidazole glycerol-phosphate synthase subunit HisH
MIAIIDYGVGNLRSVEKAFTKVGVPAQVTSDPDTIRHAPGVVLPGVGAFADCMANLNEYGLVEVVKAIIAAGKPLLGICVGMQILFEASEENGYHVGLGILGGVVKKIPGKLKVPQIGWNNLNFTKPSPLFTGIEDNSYVYFVHSYSAVPTDTGVVTATTQYGQELTVAVQRDNIYAVQFHPEKSSEIGLEMLKNFGGFIT